MANYKTHKEIETMCDLTMTDKRRRWKRQDMVGPAASWAAKWGHYLTNFPDRIYKKGNQILVLEIKPGNCRNGELKKALGQMMCYYPFDIKAYLVISPKQWEAMKGIIQLFPWLGVITYETKMKDDLTYPLEIVQKAVERTDIDLLPFPVLLIENPWPLPRKWDKIQLASYRAGSQR